MKLKIKYPNPPCKVGQLIYPIEMGLHFWDKNYWGVIVKVHGKEKRWKEIRYFTCVDCANLYSEMLQEKK